MEGAKRATRRRHDADLKTKILAECGAPGASVAQVALAHGLNANLVHKWRRQLGADGACISPLDAASFIPVTVSSSTAPMASDIRIELRRGALAINVSWPLSESAACAAWMRELLR